ncbi:MAG: cell division protein FtsL [Acidobacteria bacterium]|nr:cell division protein FtsL [Acidobacteriota bacterium]
MTMGSLRLNAKLIRERDRKVTGDLIRFLLVGSALLVPVILYVRQRMEFVRVSYRLESLEKERQHLRDEQRRLLVERAGLRSLDRVEGIARADFGLVHDHSCEMVGPVTAAAAAPDREASR